MPGLSVAIIAKNEEDRLPATLASAAFADEVVVVVDAASTDGTERVARAAGARVLVRPFDGFGPQKNAAADAAAHPWVLSLDADEVVTPPLARAIRVAIDGTPAAAAFRVRIHLEFLGRALRFGRHAVVTPARLFRRDRARFSPDAVHERLLFEGPAPTLSGRVLHRSYRDLAHYLAKLDRYTTLAAGERFAAGARPSRAPALRFAWDVFDRAVLHLGLLDGAPGLAFAVLSAGNTWFRNRKLAELRRTAAGREPS
ncbi:MAG TPA: glycosyltransferase family 2 protein [Thermoanaerobaculia bacterium]|nr:glycosyltransferase family 2 protein [Thermoanaerobaculia bacterium]